MDRTAPITSPINSEAEFARWLLAVLADERKRLRRQSKIDAGHDECPVGVTAETVSYGSAATFVHNFGGNNDD